MDDPIRFLQRASESWMLRPDLTILLRVPAGLARKRIEGRPNLVPFEDLAFLKKVAANYDRLARSRRFVVLDGTRGADVVSLDAISAIQKRLTRLQKGCSGVRNPIQSAEGMPGRTLWRFGDLPVEVATEMLCQTRPEEKRPVRSQSWVRPIARRAA